MEYISQAKKHNPVSYTMHLTSAELSALMDLPQPVEYVKFLRACLVGRIPKDIWDQPSHGRIELTQEQGLAWVRCVERSVTYFGEAFPGAGGRLHDGVPAIPDQPYFLGDKLADLYQCVELEEPEIPYVIKNRRMVRNYGLNYYDVCDTCGSITNAGKAEIIARDRCTCVPS